MDTKFSKQTRHELLEALRDRYRNAARIEKTQILDEFVDIAGCHCKHAIRLLTGIDPVMPDSPRLGRTIDSEAVREALVVLWEAADRICGKRLKAILPGLIGAMERHGHLALDPNVRQLLLAASPATIDRLLAPIRGTAGRRKKRKSTTKFSREIPVRTFADWTSRRPGSWRWTSSPTAATRWRGRSSRAWRRLTCVRGGPRWFLWSPGSSPWSSKGWKSSGDTCRYRSSGSTRTTTAPSSTRPSRSTARSSKSSSRTRSVTS